MDKRTFQALLVCFAISILYLNWITPPPQETPQQNPEVVPAGEKQEVVSNGNVSPNPAVEQSGDPATVSPTIIPVQDPVEVEIVSLSNENLELQLTSMGARLTDARLKKYKESLDSAEPLQLLSSELKSSGALGIRIPSLQLDLSKVNWKLVEQKSDSVQFRTRIGEDRFILHTLTLPDSDTYELISDLKFEGKWSAANELYYEILGAERIRFDPAGGATAYPNQWVAAQRNQDGSIKEANHEAVGPIDSGEMRKSSIAWGGLESTYFAQVIRPLGESATGSLVVRGKESGFAGASLFDEYSEEGLQGWPVRVGFNRKLDPGQLQSYAVFLGPKDPEVLSMNSSWDATQLIDYGFFGWLCRPFLFLLRTFNSFVGSWGLAIILLTFVIRAVLHPVNKRNQRQMQVQQQGMARIKPQMDEIRERFKNDPTTMHRKTQELFKQDASVCDSHVHLSQERSLHHSRKNRIMQGKMLCRRMQIFKSRFSLLVPRPRILIAEIIASVNGQAKIGTRSVGPSSAQSLRSGSTFAHHP